MLGQLRPATVSLILVLLLTSAFLIYFVSLFPAYMPYRLNEQFDRLDGDVWDIGGQKNFTVADGVLSLFDSTSANHYFVTNPKWGSFGALEAELQGSIAITFRITPLPNRSLVVASTDSWTVSVRKGTLVVETTDRAGRAPFLGGTMNSSWHRLVVDRGAGSLQFQIDDALLFRLDDWSGKLTRIELGTAQETVRGFQVRGTLCVDSVTAELRPLVEGSQSILKGYPRTATVSFAANTVQISTITSIAVNRLDPAL
jgi:hypothetical protein